MSDDFRITTPSTRGNPVLELELRLMEHRFDDVDVGLPPTKQRPAFQPWYRCPGSAEWLSSLGDQYSLARLARLTYFSSAVVELLSDADQQVVYSAMLHDLPRPKLLN